jgi:hypothetical protein
MFFGDINGWFSCEDFSWLDDWFLLVWLPIYYSTRILFYIEENGMKEHHASEH